MNGRLKGEISSGGQSGSRGVPVDQRWEFAARREKKPLPCISMARDSFAGGFALYCALARVMPLLLAVIAARDYART